MTRPRQCLPLCPCQIPSVVWKSTLSKCPLSSEIPSNTLGTLWDWAGQKRTVSGLVLDWDLGQETIMPLVLPPLPQISMNQGPQEGCLWSRQWWSDVARENLNRTETGWHGARAGSGDRSSLTMPSVVFSHGHLLSWVDSVSFFSGSLFPASRQALGRNGTSKEAEI